MCSYNALNSVPTCANQKLTEVLRGTWRFEGYITSDSGAIGDISGAHHYAANATVGTAMALQAGCDVNSGNQYHDHVQVAPCMLTLADRPIPAEYRTLCALGSSQKPTLMPHL